jgi:hypothetical protein
VVNTFCPVDVDVLAADGGAGDLVLGVGRRDTDHPGQRGGVAEPVPLVLQHPVPSGGHDDCVLAHRIADRPLQLGKLGIGGGGAHRHVDHVGAALGRAADAGVHLAGSRQLAGSPIQPLAPLLAQAGDVDLHLVLARRSGGASRALYSR